jgi:L-2-aminoadipate reductase
MLKGCIQLSTRPDINNTVNMAPVDHVARVVTSSAFFPSTTPLGVAQVTSHPRLRFNEFLGTLETYGYKVPKTDYIPWKTSLERYVADDNDQDVHALMPLYHFVTADLPSSTKAPELDDANTTAALFADKAWTGEDHSKGSSVTEDTMGIYLAYLVAVGFLPAPTEKDKRQLPAITLTAETREAQKAVGGRGGLV